jgi:cbb3-type cytochrome oxidase subunit 3
MKNNKALTLFLKVTIPCLVFLFAFNFLASPIAAQQTDPFGVNYAANAGLPKQDPRSTIANLIRVALGFLGTIAVVIILYGGVLWMTAAGSQEKVDQAKKLLFAGVAGLIIIMSAWGIAEFIIGQIFEAANQ